MTDRIRIAITAVAAASALLLSACGGGDDGANDEIEGVEENNANGDQASQGPGATPTEDDGIDRPEIELPDDVHNVFEEVDTDDPVELAVLADHERRVNSLDEAITSGDMNRPALGFYSTGDALQSAVRWVDSLVSKNESFTGTTRYYNRQVTVEDEDSATVTFCIDPSESLTMDRVTGEVEPDSGVTTRVHYATSLEKNDMGVWQTTEAVADKETDLC